MKVKYKFAQNTILDNNQLMSLLPQMYMVVITGTVVIPNLAMSKIKKHFSNIGLVEKQDYVFHENHLLIKKAVFGQSIKDDIAELFNINTSDVGVMLPNAKKEEIESKSKDVVFPEWMLLEVPNGLSSLVVNGEHLIDNLSNFLFHGDYVLDKDYAVVGGKFFINLNSKNLYDTIVAHLSELEIVDINKIRLISPSSPMAAYDDISGTKISGVSTHEISDLLTQNNYFEGYDYVVVFVKEWFIILNRTSSRYDDVINLIKTYMSIKHPDTIYHIDIEKKEAVSGKRAWKEVAFKKIPFKNFMSFVKDYLVKRHFIENEDYYITDDRFFINIMSVNFPSLEKTLMMLSVNNDFLFFINYVSGKKEDERISSRWGATPPQKFYDSSYEQNMTDGLFMLAPDDSHDVRMLKVFYAEECISSLLKQNASDFFATTSGYFFYNKSQENIIESTVSSWDSQLQKQIQLLKNLPEGKLREQFVKKIVGEAKYNEFQAFKTVKQKNQVEDFWSKEGPFINLPMPSEKVLSLIGVEISRSEKANGYLFQDLSIKDKSSVVRKAISKLGLFPGYCPQSSSTPGTGSYGGLFFDKLTLTNSVIDNEGRMSGVFDLISKDNLAFSEFRKLSEKMGVDCGKLSDYRDFTSRGFPDFGYEYLLSKNSMNTLKVNSFLSAFYYNQFKKLSKGDSSGEDKNALATVMISLFYEVLEKMKTQPMFSPVPGDENKKRLKLLRYWKFVMLAEKAFSWEDARESKIFKNIESVLKYSTVEELKASPYYKEILRYLANKYSKALSEAMIYVPSDDKKEEKPEETLEYEYSNKKLLAFKHLIGIAHLPDLEPYDSAMKIISELTGNESVAKTIVDGVFNVLDELKNVNLKNQENAIQFIANVMKIEVHDAYEVYNILASHKIVIPKKNLSIQKSKDNLPNALPKIDLDLAKTTAVISLIKNGDENQAFNEVKELILNLKVNHFSTKELMGGYAKQIVSNIFSEYEDIKSIDLESEDEPSIIAKIMEMISVDNSMAELILSALKESKDSKDSKESKNFSSGDILWVKPVSIPTQESYPASEISDSQIVKVKDNGVIGGTDVYDAEDGYGNPVSIYGFQVFEKIEKFPKINPNVNGNLVFSIITMILDNGIIPTIAGNVAAKYGHKLEDVQALVGFIVSGDKINKLKNIDLKKINAVSLIQDLFYIDQHIANNIFLLLSNKASKTVKPVSPDLESAKKNENYSAAVYAVFLLNTTNKAFMEKFPNADTGNLEAVNKANQFVGNPLQAKAIVELVNNEYQNILSLDVSKASFAKKEIKEKLFVDDATASFILSYLIGLKGFKINKVDGYSSAVEASFVSLLNSYINGTSVPYSAALNKANEFVKNEDNAAKIADLVEEKFDEILHLDYSDYDSACKKIMSILSVDWLVAQNIASALQNHSEITMKSILKMFGHSFKESTFNKYINDMVGDDKKTEEIFKFCEEMFSKLLKFNFKDIDSTVNQIMDSLKVVREDAETIYSFLYNLSSVPKLGLNEDFEEQVTEEKLETAKVKGLFSVLQINKGTVPVKLVKETLIEAGVEEFETSSLAVKITLWLKKRVEDLKEVDFAIRNKAIISVGQILHVDYDSSTYIVDTINKLKLDFPEFFKKKIDLNIDLDDYEDKEQDGGEEFDESADTLIEEINEKEGAKVYIPEIEEINEKEGAKVYIPETEEDKRSNVIRAFLKILTYQDEKMNVLSDKKAVIEYVANLFGVDFKYSETMLAYVQGNMVALDNAMLFSKEDAIKKIWHILEIPENYAKDIYDYVMNYKMSKKINPEEEELNKLKKNIFSIPVGNPGNYNSVISYIASMISISYPNYEKIVSYVSQSLDTAKENAEEVVDFVIKGLELILQLDFSKPESCVNVIVSSLTIDNDKAANLYQAISNDKDGAYEHLSSFKKQKELIPSALPVDSKNKNLAILRSVRYLTPVVNDESHLDSNYSEAIQALLDLGMNSEETTIMVDFVKSKLDDIKDFIANNGEIESKKMIASTFDISDEYASKVLEILMLEEKSPISENVSFDKDKLSKLLIGSMKINKFIFHVSFLLLKEGRSYDYILAYVTTILGGNEKESVEFVSFIYTQLLNCFEATKHKYAKNKISSLLQIPSDLSIKIYNFIVGNENIVKDNLNKFGKQISVDKIEELDIPEEMTEKKILPKFHEIEELNIPEEVIEKKKFTKFDQILEKKPKSVKEHKSKEDIPLFYDGLEENQKEMEKTVAKENIPSLNDYFEGKLEENKNKSLESLFSDKPSSDTKTQKEPEDEEQEKIYEENLKYLKKSKMKSESNARMKAFLYLLGLNYDKESGINKAAQAAKLLQKEMGISASDAISIVHDYIDKIERIKNAFKNKERKQAIISIASLLGLLLQDAEEVYESLGLLETT